MQTPLEIAFRHMDADDDIKALVEEKAQQLEKYFDGITSCHVYLGAPHRSQQKGTHFEVTIELRVPGTELVVKRDRKGAGSQGNLAVMVRDAFSAMTVELKRWKEQMQGEVKTLDGQLQGKVMEIRHEQDFGQIIAADGRMIYFHRNSVTNADFDEMQTGDAVELVVQTDESDIGPQASAVRRISDLALDPVPKSGRR